MDVQVEGRAASGWNHCSLGRGRVSEGMVCLASIGESGYVGDFRRGSSIFLVSPYHIFCQGLNGVCDNSLLWCKENTIYIE